MHDYFKTVHIFGDTFLLGLRTRQDLELAYGKPASEDQESKRQTHLGVEFSGLSASGRRVMGIVQRGLATTVLADNRYLWEVPPNWSLASASTVPVAYCTAYYALVLRGQLKPKQTVVVYHGASDIGLAAIRLALHMNCKVYTTYENREQMCYLISCFLEVPLKNTGQHWDPTFEKMVLQRTGGRGADVVLNQLGADKMAAALGCLAHNGTLLNIGDNYSNCTNLPQLSNNKSIHSIDMSSITEDERLQVANLLSEGIKWGHVYPIEHNCYSNHLGDFREAFEKLSRSDCIGKVIVRYECSGNKSTDRN
ncbi:zinc-binding dehydrogenase domain-containing protein [Phthorimaea operculella]|nr:zinc-binding dehydrogenase domain-containing protein [Phthorimaea operculella]